ncbi:MAG: phasin family protein [Desulfonatronovibrio sp.]|nr:phasin family protein [Desulfovibrionales bacterium]
MIDLFKKGFFTGLGLVVITAEEVEKKIQTLVDKGKLSAEEGENIVNDFVHKSESQQGQVQEWISKNIKSTMESLDIARKEDVENLEARVASLEDRIATLETLRIEEGKKTDQGQSV